MDFCRCIRECPAILMEGALGERLKREYHLAFDKQVAMANLVNTKEGWHSGMSTRLRSSVAVAEPITVIWKKSQNGCDTISGITAVFSLYRMKFKI